jgi:hypothetical protein
MTMDKLSPLIRCSLFTRRRTLLRGWLTEISDSKKKHEEQNSTLKPEVRSEVCNLCRVVIETLGVLLLFGVTQCYSHSKIKSVIINCNSTWCISNKSSNKIRNPLITVVSPSKHVTISMKYFLREIVCF